MKKKLTLLLSLLIANGVHADCNDDPNNLMQNANCDFTANASSWSPVLGNGAIIHNPTDDFLLGSGAAGSASVTGVTSGVGFTSSIQSACVSVPDSTTRTAGVWIKGDPTLLLNCSVRSFDFSDNNCLTGGGIIGATGSFQAAIGSPWTLHSYTLTPTGTTGSTYLRVLCSNPAQFNYGIDNAFISQQGSLPVELQSFSVE